jgi:hypothetical protein
VTNDQIKAAVFDAGGGAIATNKLVSSTPSDQTDLFDLGLAALSN